MNYISEEEEKRMENFKGKDLFQYIGKILSKKEELTDDMKVEVGRDLYATFMSRKQDKTDPLKNSKQKTFFSKKGTKKKNIMDVLNNTPENDPRIIEDTRTIEFEKKTVETELDKQDPKMDTNPPVKKSKSQLKNKSHNPNITVKYEIIKNNNGEIVKELLKNRTESKTFKSLIVKTNKMVKTIINDFAIPEGIERDKLFRNVFKKLKRKKENKINNLLKMD